MSQVCTEELVYTESEDGLLLEGAVIRPASGPAKPLPIIWTHGLTGKFYSPGTVKVGRALAARGYTFVTGNSRGHDFGAIYRSTTGDRLIRGGGWERFDESPRDVAAWIGFAVGLGFPGVALLGHSLGALKVGYYQGQRQDPRVRGLIVASPPLRAGQVDPELLARAERLVAEGHGEDLLPWNATRAGAGTQSAETYLNRVHTNVDVYGSRAENPVAAQIRCSIFAFYGTDEEWVGNAADLEIIRRNARSAARVDTRLFEGADHSYTGHETEVAAAIAEWVDGLH
ncbi:MAG TPA: alpha/beta fold hydrolase [Chloroflexota bacterium]|nr:alpha/beta fold hydrolase [Chloroflexota bacterium]